MSARDFGGLADRPYDGALLELLDGRGQPTLQGRWQAVESELWPEWVAGRGRLEPVIQWSWGAAALVLSRAVRPGWVLLPRARLSQWLGWLPAGHPLPGRHACLCEAVAQVDWARHPDLKRRAALLGLRVMLARGYTQLEEIESGDLETMPVACATGIDVLDSALCQLGVLSRTPQRGAQRRLRRGRLSPAELVERSRVPERFRDVHRLYLEAYAQRISDVYATTRHKHNSLEQDVEIGEVAQGVGEDGPDGAGLCRVAEVDVPVERAPGHPRQRAPRAQQRPLRRGGLLRDLPLPAGRPRADRLRLPAGGRRARDVRDPRARRVAH